LHYYYDAIKNENSNALATFNNGVREQCYKWYYNEDYTAGEFNDFETIPDKKYYDGSRAHILAQRDFRLPVKCGDIGVRREFLIEMNI